MARAKLFQRSPTFWLAIFQEEYPSHKKKERRLLVEDIHVAIESGIEKGEVDAWIEDGVGVLRLKSAVTLRLRLEGGLGWVGLR